MAILFKDSDPQLADPIKRALILALYKAIKVECPEIEIRHAAQYERELEREASLHHQQP